MKLISILLLSSLVLAGCGAVTPMKSTQITALKSDKVAVLSSYPSKDIHYSEAVFKGFFTTIEESYTKFSGLWDIDKDLTEIFTVAFHKKGVDAVSAKTVLDANNIKSLNEVLKEQVPYRVTPTTSATFRPRQTIPPLKISDDILASLNDKEIKYLLVIKGDNLSISPNPFMKFHVLWYPVITYVIDIDSGEAIWSSQFLYSTSGNHEDSVREYEKQSLRKLKETMSSMIDVAFDNHSKQMGFTPAI